MATTQLPKDLWTVIVASAASAQTKVIISMNSGAFRVLASASVPAADALGDTIDGGESRTTITPADQNLYAKPVSRSAGRARLPWSPPLLSPAAAAVPPPRPSR